MRLRSAHDFKIVLTTAGSPAEARRLASRAVRHHQAACVNWIPAIRSVYWWKGKVTSGTECLLLFKTTQRQVPELCRFIRKNHSYDLPELLVLSLEQGETAYLTWISNSLNLLTEHDGRN